ncbi:restriction endonuclease subunit S [Shewanella algae]|uniref:restriction endonuclease subunit S n=1 Tax=Shewanella algae TaxID=38313 RepID=UPI000D14EA8F|nr:restriction endonuclease subunit S [Shewanella algae]PST68171.1 hypothetical protein AYI77_03935 [Shewanella algae]
MSFEWKSHPLHSVGRIVTGKTPSSNIEGAFDDQGIPFITPSDMDGRRCIDSTVRYLSEVGLEVSKKYLVPEGSVAVSCIGSDMGKAVLVGQDSVTNQQINTIIVDESQFNPVFVYYVLSTMQQELKNIASGSATPILNKTHFGNVEIRAPKRELQNKIVSILEPSDLKITLNTQTNQTLEQMAQALFKSWFVDFDPVIDNALDSGFFEREFAGEGIPEPLAQRAAVRQAMRQSLREAGGTDTAAPVIGGLPSETRALFPDSFEEHPELGWIPKGWMVKSLAEQTKLIGGGTPKRSNEEFWGGGIPWFSVKDAPNNSDVFVLDTDEKITVAGLDGSSTRLLPVGTTIISARGTVGKLALVGREMAMNQSCYGVLPADGLGLGVYFNYFSLKRIVYWLRQNTHGAVFDTITKQTFETVSSVVPPSTIASEFERQVTPWLDLVKSKLLENVSLSQLRDTLLPKLLSGELTVFDVCQENQVESKVA